MKNRFHKLIGLLTAVILICVLFAGCATAGAEGAEGTTGGFGSYGGIIVLVVMLLFFYFVIMRPENKKKKQAEEMRNNLSVGDKITTIGGMVGKIVNISGDLITFETGEDRVRIQVTKWAISTNSIEKSDPNSK